MRNFMFRFAVGLLVLLPLPAQAKSGFDISALPGEAAQKVELHGYYEFEYWSQQGKNTSFDIHKVVVWMGTRINDLVFLSSEFEYEHFPRLAAKEERDGGNGELKLDSAQLRITPAKNSAAYLGLFYVPFGIEYHSYPGHKNKLVTRPKVMKGGGIIPGTWSDVGIGFTHIFENFGEADIFYLNGDAKNGGISRDSAAGGNEAKSAGARIMLNRAIRGLNIGASYVRGKYDEAGLLYATRYGVHLRLDLDIVAETPTLPVFIAEYVAGTNEAASSEKSAGGLPEDQDVSGFYVQMSSEIIPGIELVTRYGDFDEDKKKSDNKKTELSVGAALTPLKNFRIKGEYHWQWNDEKNNAAVLQVVVNW